MLEAYQRAVAQLGSALDWGSRGREFKSPQPDAQNLRISGGSGFVGVEGFCVRRPSRIEQVCEALDGLPLYVRKNGRIEVQCHSGT